MRILIDAVAATGAGAGKSTIREMASTFPVLRPEHDYVFVVQPALAHVVHDVEPSVRTISPPEKLASTPQRVAWEHGILPLTVRRFRPDVVYSPFNVVPTLWPRPKPALAVTVMNLAPYAPAVLAMYGPRTRLRFAAHRRLTDRSIAGADVVFLQSKQGFALIGSALLNGKAEVVYPVAPPPQTGYTATARLPAPYFVVVADLYRYKGVELAVEALATVVGEDLPHLVVCGRHIELNYARSLKDRAITLGLERRVHFRGEIGHTEVLELLRGARACIAPSRFENLSRIPSEAMFAETPIIASDIPSYREICGDAALYFSLAAPDELAAHMRSLAVDEQAREHLVARGRAILNQANVPNPSESILEALERIAASR
jgi:glycosyltransferase involved in cell wall biosynthesis